MVAPASAGEGLAALSPRPLADAAQACRHSKINREKLDLEFQAGDWVDLGDLGVACDVHEIYRWKETGEVSYERDRRIELTIRDGKISRYEMRIVG